MVKNQNWERRVEAATARRKEVKQRKQKNEDKRQYKMWMQDLLRLLDQQSDRLRHANLRPKIRLHVWADTMATDSPRELLDWLLVAQDDISSPRSARRKSRSNSMEVELAATTTTTANSSSNSASSGAQKGRGRSNSLSESYKPSKRKVHPRSRDSFDETSEADKDGLPPSLLCHSHFFSGRCEESRGKKVCRYLHYDKPYLTLHEVLSAKQPSPGKIAAAASAAELATSEELALSDPGSMEMVHYCSFEIETNDRAELISSQIVSALAQKEIKHASIVYASLDDVLVYDRFRDGVLLSNDEQVAAALADGNVLLNRKMSSASDEGSVNEDGIAAFDDLPGTVLEHILTFLPDVSVATACQVCKAWYYEIGQNSPNLWRHLLERRHWPLPAELTQVQTSEPDTQTLQELAIFERKRYREAFLRHYSVVRDASAIKSALQALSQRQKCFASLEVACVDFSTLRNRPTTENFYQHILPWARNQVLTTYSDDCTLRLFESMVKPDGSGILCKELVCQTVDPYRNTKKRTCALFTAALDEECIGCVCEVESSTLPLESYILVVVNREEFLMGGSSTGVDADPGYNLSVIDIGEAVLNYILSMDHVDSKLEELIYFLEGDYNELADIEIAVSPIITACGYGRFMLEVLISIPNDSSLDEVLIFIDQRLVLFSAGTGAIVWMDSSGLTEGATHPSYKLVSSIRRQLPFGPRSSCTIAVSTREVGDAIRILDIEPSGEVFQKQVLQYHLRKTPALLATCRRIRVCSTYVVIFDIFSYPITDGHTEDMEAANDRNPMANDGANDDDNNNTARGTKVFITCLPRLSFGDEQQERQPFSVIDLIDLGEDVRPTDVVCIRDEHMILLCERETHEAVAGDPNDGDTRSEGTNTEQWALLIHIPTGEEIGRQLWSQSDECIVITEDSQNTVGVGFSFRGVVMTGHDVREVAHGSMHTLSADSKSSISPNLRKKKKKSKAKGNKKDAYARGMTMRG